MNKLSLRVLCQIYLLLVLLAATILSALPYFLLALALLLVTLFITWRPLPPRFSTVITVATVFLVPLVLEPLLSSPTPTTGISLTITQISAAMSILPVIYLLDYNLRQNAQGLTVFAKGSSKGRYITTDAKTLFTSALTILLVSLSLNNQTLLFTCSLFTLYLLGTMTRVFLAIPQLPLNAPLLWKRVIAGTTVDISLPVTSQSSMRLHGLLNPVDPWVKVTPQRFTVSRDKMELNLTVTPPLAGLSRPQLQASAMDPRGFIQINQLFEPVALHVIPRAKYAAWLAVKYLEQTESGITTAESSLAKVTSKTKRGMEYFDSRSYQPGDPLKNLDWKHTLKLNRLIVKEFVDTGGQSAIIAVNLSVTDAKEADKIAFNLITTALTLAQETIPTALAVYNHQRVVLTTPVTDPREILRWTLALVKDITSTNFAHRFLQLSDLRRLRRDIAELKQSTSEPAQRLLDMLNFEYQAIEKAARNHPATLALLLATEQAPPPATIVLISQFNHDAEALMVTTEKLSRRKFTTIPIETR
ncbi:DUF58 domain-containing protein [Chloroflexota bacterium]